MLKKLTWISVALTVMGALFDSGGSDQSGLETAAEIVMLAKVFGGDQAASPSTAGAPADQGAAQR